MRVKLSKSYIVQCSLGIVGLILVEREKKIKIMGTYRLVDRLVTTYRSKENFSSNLSKWRLNHQNDDQSCQKKELGRKHHHSRLKQKKNAI